MITDFSQVDEALLKHLAGLMIEDENGAPKEVPIVYIDPEIEFQISEYPTIVIFRQGIYPNDYRWTNDKFYDNPVYDEKGDLITLDERDAPDPFNMYYGIRLYYQYQMDGVKLNQHIMSKLRRGSFLSINEDEYDIIFVSYKNPEATYRTYGDQPENKQREFYEQYLYKVEMELDNAPRETVPVSQELLARIKILNP